MFAVKIEFLEGRVIAARPDNPSLLEWPLEPARLYMAMVAAYHENEQDDVQRSALEWFEDKVPARIDAPKIFPRSVVTLFVPVNDQCENPHVRGKQPRTFPSGYVGDSQLIFTFNEDIPPALVEPLAKILAKVVRIGHSSSLVRCHLITTPGSPAVSSDAMPFESWLPASAKRISADTTTHRVAMRVSTEGALARLESDYNLPAIEDYADLTSAIRSAPSRKEANSLKKTRDAKYAQPPAFRRPTIGIREFYISSILDNDHVDEGIKTTVFDPTIIVLEKFEGIALGLESTLAVAASLRDMILKQFQHDAPTWVSGHEMNGATTHIPHLAIIPLPFVGSRTAIELNRSMTVRPPFNEYADGHLMGVGLVLPRNLTDREKGDALGDLLYDDFGEPKPIELLLGKLGTWTLRRQARSIAPKALSSETWSRPSRFWATVTPIVLDRFPKCDRLENVNEWNAEVADIIAQSCENIGLDRPCRVRILRHGPIAGVPSSQPDRSGFPLLIGNDGKPRGFQTHAVLEFSSRVHGPLLLGAGRFRGYGMCKPVEVSQS